MSRIVGNNHRHQWGMHMSRETLQGFRNSISLYVALCLAPGCGDGWQTIDQLKQAAGEQAGQQVTVRGYALQAVTVAGVGCIPPNGCCSQANLFLILTPTAHSSATFVELQRQSIAVYPQDLNSPFCAGNECAQTCTPFVPLEGVAYELTGTLGVQGSYKCISLPGAPPLPSSCRADSGLLRLTHLDVAASSQLTGDGDLSQLHRQPIVPGTYLHTSVPGL
jgi:hypothetical protein